MSALYAIIVAIVGFFVYGSNKRKQTEALDENAGTLEQLHTDDAQLAQNQGKLNGEEALRNQEAQKVVSDEKDTNINNVIDFLNRVNKK